MNREPTIRLEGSYTLFELKKHIKKLEKIKRSTTNKDFKIHSIDNGMCRVNYITRNSKNELVYYCLQDECSWKHLDVNCYRCSSDFEPSYTVKHDKNRFEVPTGDSKIEKTIREFLTGEE